MKELIDHIPFLDVIIVALIAFFIYLGWNHGLPKLVMGVGAVYTGFLLASIYYHLFASMLMRTFKMTSAMTADVISFLLLDTMITLLMAALLINLFGHVEIKGRLVIFDKVGGALGGLLVGVMVVSIFMSVLRVPAESERATEAAKAVPAISLFNDGFSRSALAPLSVKAAPYMMSSIMPMLPPEARDNGAVPLLETIVAEQ